MKKWLKIFIGILLTPFILSIVLAVLLYIPPIQQWAAEKATAYVKSAYGTDISIGRIRISFPLDIELEGLRVLQDEADIASLESLVVDLDMMHILMLQIKVDAIELNSVTVNTSDLIESVRIDGTLERFFLKAEQIDLLKSDVSLAQAEISGADIKVTLGESAETDTTDNNPLPWKIGIEKIAINNANLSLLIPTDSMNVGVQIQECTLNDGAIDLPNGIYEAQNLLLQTDTVRYDIGDMPVEQRGIDFGHLMLLHSTIGIEAPHYNMTSGTAKADIRISDVKEKSDLGIDLFSACLGMDSIQMWAENVSLQTPNTQLNAQARVGFSTLKPKGKGPVSVKVDGKLGKADLEQFIAESLTENELKAIPDKPVELSLLAEGDTRELHLRECNLAMENTFNCGLEGTVKDITDWDNAEAKITATAQTQDMRWIQHFLNTQRIALPPTQLEAEFLKEKNKYAANAVLIEGKGRISVTGKADLQQMTYNVNAEIDSIRIDHYLPKDSVFSLSATASLNGSGSDFMSPKTRLSGIASIDNIGFKQWDLSNMELKVNLNEGTGIIDFQSDNELLNIHACAESKINKKRSDANFNLNLNHIDLHALNLARDTLSASMIMKVDGSTNFKDRHHVEGHIHAMELVVHDSVYHPLDMNMKALFEPDSIFLNATSGDLLLSAVSSQGLDEVLKRINDFYTELTKQREQYYINQDTLRTLLPQLQLHLHSGKRNPMHNILQHMTGFSYNDLLLEINATATEGLQGNGHVYSMHTGKLPVDTIQWNIAQNTRGVSLKGKVSNNPKNKVAVFESNMSAHITPTGVIAKLDYIDKEKKKGIDLGLKADATAEGMRLGFFPAKPIIAYRTFTLNKGNFISLNRNGKVEAQVDLIADDGTGLKVYTTPNDEALQDISAEFNRINLGELSSVLPYFPSLAGYLKGDVRYLQSDSTVEISAETLIENFKYENSPIGNIGMNAVYLPSSDSTHYINALVTHEGKDAIFLDGEYKHKTGRESINIAASLEHLPLHLANGFIPDKVIELSGYAKGNLQVTGTTSSPTLNGQFLTEDMKINSSAYSLNLTFPNDTIHIKQNVVDLDRIEAYAIGKNPMVMDGTVSLKDPDNMTVNLAVMAKNYELINANKTRDAQAYGKVYVDIAAFLRGTLDNLKLRGKLNVLGKTDVTYVLKDSPISAEDQLADLVEFVDMTDTQTEQQKVVMASPQRIDMLFTVNIEQAAQVHCLLSESGSDYVNIEGGGELTLSYDNQNNMLLNGRYTILEGDMKYSLMELVSKHFTIQPNSYVEFHGNMMNPTLNIRASERVKSTVTENNVPRSVNFDVGLRLSQSLENMGLEFTLEAPEDMTIQNELAAMSPEQRGRVAVTMLATGIYLTDNHKASGANSTNALFNYLQGQVNAIAGKALKTVDVNFGIENTINQAGGSQTDYNFSFAKRFWGNRVRLIIGGKVSSGNNVVNNGQSIIDNVSLEYRLDNSATRYVKLYYDKNYESLLEGELTEMGAGAVFRRKSGKLGDLFIFRKKKK